MRWLVLSFLLMFGCDEEGQILVEMQTDLRPGEEFDRIDIRVLGSGSLARNTEVVVSATDDFERGQRIADFSGLPPGNYSVAATLRFAGARIGRTERSIKLESVAGVSLLVTRDCAGVTCPGAGDAQLSSCHGGRCVAPECPSEPNACGESECSVGSDCPELSACARAECMDGACFYLESACAEGGRCRVESGCSAAMSDAGTDGVSTDSGRDSAGVDAGVDAVDSGPDAGPPDLGWQLRGEIAHFCAFRIGQDGLYCWGQNTYGQLGTGAVAPVPIATRVLGLTGAMVDASTGSRGTCALTDDGAFCWGANDQGQVGDGTRVDRLTPTRAVTKSRLVRISLGINHTCGVSAAGEGICWGLNTTGELGRGMASERELAPEAVAGGGPYVDVLAGSQYTCMVEATGGVRCFGARAWTGTGGGGGVVLTPTPALGVADAIALGGGSNHTCANNAAGELRCWGSNALGSVGVTEADSVTVPVIVGVSDVFAFSAGAHSTMALSGTGVAFAWGGNDDGQLGLPAGDPVRRPVASEVLPTDLQEVAMGGFSACGVRADDTVVCWGRNVSGGFGNGLLTGSSAVPVEVLGLPD